MEKTDRIEFTEEGLKKLCEALTELPEEQRRKIVISTIQAVIRA